jgi:hypothetical protein
MVPLQLLSLLPVSIRSDLATPLLSDLLPMSGCLMAVEY